MASAYRFARFTSVFAKKETHFGVLVICVQGVRGERARGGVAPIGDCVRDEHCPKHRNWFPLDERALGSEAGCATYVSQTFTRCCAAPTR